METATPTKITVQTSVNAPLEKVWRYWASPEHITRWCHASDDWHAPSADNDLRPGGKFRTTMAAKDGSFSFDFGGEYTLVENNRRIESVLGDGRKVAVEFRKEDNATIVTETFEAENTNSIEMQRGGWQAILDNFRRYTEAN